MKYAAAAKEAEDNTSDMLVDMYQNALGLEVKQQAKKKKRGAAAAWEDKCKKRLRVV